MSRSFVSLKVFDETLVVGTTAFTKSIFVGDGTQKSLHISWDGWTAADIQIQTSNDPRVQSSPEDARYYGEPTTVSGMDGSVADGDYVLHVGNVGSSFLRLQFIPTTGGAVKVWSTAKF